MTEFFESLTTSQQIFWGCFVISGVFVVLQTITTLLGIGGDSADFNGVDADTGMGDAGVASEAMQMFSLRNFVNFFFGFGLTGVCLEKYIESTALLTLAAVAVGIGFVLLFVFIFKQMMKFEHSGNVDVDKDVIGQEADVYLVISEGKRGQVQLSIRGSVHEYEAVAANPAESIPTGSRVKIVRRQGSTLVVERI